MLSYVPCNVFLLVAQEVLEVPIIEEELTNAIHAVVKEKSLGPDGLMTDFLKTY